MVNRRLLLFVILSLFLIAGCADDIDLVEPAEVMLNKEVGIMEGVVDDDLEYEILRLGGFPGEGIVVSEPYAINNNGKIVGLSRGYAFIWENNTTGGEMQVLNSGSFGTCRARGINDYGIIVGECDELPVRWDNAASDPEKLPLDDNHVNGRADDINNQGVIAGQVGTDGGTHRVAVWINNDNDPKVLSHEGNADGWLVHVVINDDNIVATTLDDIETVVWEDLEDEPVTLPHLGADMESDARGINNNGDIVGISLSGGDSFAVLWSYSGNGWSDPVMVGSGNAQDVTDRDDNGWVQIVGSNYPNHVSEDQRGHRWVVNAVSGALKYTQTLPIPDELHHRSGIAGANFINADGWIVGGTRDRNNDFEATLWRPVYGEEPPDDDPDPGDGEKLLVSNIDHREQGPHLRVTITVVDENDQPVGGVSVEAETTNNNGAIFSATGTTDSDGTFSYRWQHGGGDGPYETCVTDLDLEGYQWVQDEYCETVL